MSIREKIAENHLFICRRYDGEYQLKFVVGVQSFDINMPMDKDETEWMRDMFAKALMNIPIRQRTVECEEFLRVGEYCRHWSDAFQSCAFEGRSIHAPECQNGSGKALESVSLAEGITLLGEAREALRPLVEYWASVDRDEEAIMHGDDIETAEKTLKRLGGEG